MILIVDAGNTTITFAAVDMTTKNIVKRFKTDEEKYDHMIDRSTLFKSSTGKL